MTHTRKTYESRGRRAERWAAVWLRLKAYRVLQTRYRTPKGEVDLIVRRGSHIAFVEVKTRPTLRLAKESISKSQQTRIIDAAHYWLMKHPRETFETASFDAVFLVPYHLPIHIKQAFDLSPM